MVSIVAMFVMKNIYIYLVNSHISQISFSSKKIARICNLNFVSKISLVLFLLIRSSIQYPFPHRSFISRFFLVKLINDRKFISIFFLNFLLFFCSL